MANSSLTHEQLTRKMCSLLPGDVLTNFDCPVHHKRRVLVLDRDDDGWLEFSGMSDSGLSIVVDPRGPFRWDDGRQTFSTKKGAAYGHVTATIEVLEGTGSEQSDWYRALSDPQYDPYNIDPNNLPGAYAERSIMAKINALLQRESDGDGGAQQVRNVSQALDLVCDGALDARQASLILYIINGVATKAVQDQQREHPLAGLEGMMGGSLSDMLMSMATFGDDDGDKAPRGNGRMDRTAHHHGR